MRQRFPLSRGDKVILATKNEGKLREFRRLLPELDIVSLADYPWVQLPSEGARSFRENALVKARAVLRATGRVSLADDSGLEVDILGGAPGVMSARYAGNGASDSANVELLLRNLSGIHSSKRTGRFVCVLALAAPEGEWVFEGVCEGAIALAPSGFNGFGYDPVFIPHGARRTFAEMAPDEKDIYSHRARAAAQLRQALISGDDSC